MLDSFTRCILFAWLIGFGGKIKFFLTQDFLAEQNNLACNVVVDAGPDMSLCMPGTIELQGTAEGDVLFTLWTPATGLSDPTILDPTASVSNTITYTLTAWGIDPNNPNIIVNGDFEDGNTGFSSDYNYVQDIPGIQDEMVPAGTYTVINNPFLVHEAWSQCDDHTPGSADQMMLINGELALQDFWCQTVDVLPGTYYNVEAWVSSVHPSSPAVLQFSINGTPIGQIINAPSNTCDWIPFNAIWDSGSATTAEICIINLNTTAFGNDFALDDITMVALCEVADEVTIYVEAEPAPIPEITGPSILCADELASYVASLPPDPLVLSYTWSVTGGNIQSGQGTSEVNIQWMDAQTGLVCLMIETECDENENCFEVTVNALPDIPLITGPPSLCPGQQGTFTTQVEDVVYNWIVPPEVTIITGEGTNEILVQSAGEGEIDICLQVTNDCGMTDNCTPLVLDPSYETQFDTTLCEGETVMVNGTIYGNGNLNGYENFVSVNGCDSIVTITITETSSIESMIDITLCPGDSILLEGSYQTEEGIYIDSFLTATGCDSIIITEVIISSTDTTWFTASTCNPSEAGTTTETFSSGSCDSIVITETLLAPSDTISIVLASCIAADTGQVIDIFTNQYGCDSIVTTTTLFQLSDTTRLFQTSCDWVDVGVFVEELSNVNGCDSLIITTVSFSLSDTTELNLITCSINDTATTSSLLTNVNGCDSLVIQHRIYGGSDTTFLFSDSCFPGDTGWTSIMLSNLNGCDSIISMYVDFILADTTYVFQESCNALDTGIVSELFTDLQGCDSIVITQTALSPELEIEVTVDSMYGGFGVPCFGDNVGHAHVDIIAGGTPPFSIEWSSGDTTLIVSNLIPGKYYVSVDDDNGCMSSDSILITEPPPLTAEFETTDIKCFNETNGTIQISKVEGGVQPWSSSLNSSPYQNNFRYENLSAGIYILQIKDANGCIIEDTFNLTEPDPWSIDLGKDSIVDYGASIVIQPQFTGAPAGMLTYVWSDEKCNNCPTRIFEINDNFSIQLTVTDESGCLAQDEINLQVIIPEQVYIPNVFTPNGDQVNDVFFVNTNPFIEVIDELSVFDRWGNMVFERFDFAPNDPDLGWDGRMDGKLFNPAVFAYKVVITYRDGTRKVFHGDVTLIR